MNDAKVKEIRPYDIKLAGMVAELQNSQIRLNLIS